MNKDVEFDDVVYTVKQTRYFANASQKRCLLKGVSGVFKQGQLSAIMGPSGAGKSSLLNALSGFRTCDITGTIITSKHSSAYIVQEDVHRSLMSVQEMMELACKLKVKPCLTYSTIIDEILLSLNLSHRRKETADHLSGGERKRLSIALELVANPSIFYLDEPTSGLDEVTALQCIRTLKNLAKDGRNVVCTIHQPSAAIFSLFDQIFILAQGQCVYQGSPKSLVPFLASINLVCPNHYNPADYIIELCEGDTDNNMITTLTDIFQNGRFICSPVQDKETGAITHVVKPTGNLMLFEKKKPSVGKIIEKMKAITKFMHNENEASGIKQFLILFQMMMTKTYRSKIPFWIQLGHHLLCGFMIGLIFYNTANDGEKMFEHLKYCIGCIFFVVYTQVMVPVLSYPQEVKIVKKECFNRWYGLTPYYLALTLSRLPLQIMLNSIFFSLVYWMAGQPCQLWRFGLFCLVGNVASLVAEGLGLLIGSTFNITNGCATGPLLMAPFIGLAIYGFDFAHQIPTYMNVLMKFSFIRGGVVGLVLTLFGYDRKKLNCNEMYCHFDDPKVLLKFLAADEFSVWTEIGICLCIGIFFRFMCFMSLRKRVVK